MLFNVNIDHVATLRQARGGIEPSVLEAALIVEKCKCDAITVHLREDRRHIQDADLFAIKKSVNIPINLEMALSEEIIEIALKLKPQQITIVPERREELTTEGGFDIVKYFDKATSMLSVFKGTGILLSLFIDPDKDQISASKSAGVEIIEIHTGEYSNSSTTETINHELNRIEVASKMGKELGLQVAAGHGLNYINIASIMKISEIEELNIGHSIISRSIFVGLENAVLEMKKLVEV